MAGPLRWLNFNHLSGSANLLTCFLTAKTRVGSWSECQQLPNPLQRSDKRQSPRPDSPRFCNTMATCDADPHAAYPRGPDLHALPDEGSADEVLPVLKNDHVERIIQLRDKIRARETDPERYELCVQTRDELLRESSEVQLLAAACDHVMSTHCAEYKDWKLAREKRSTKRTKLDEDAEWDRFLGVAERGLEIKSQCLSPLKTVADRWGKMLSSIASGFTRGISTATFFAQQHGGFATGREP